LIARSVTENLDVKYNEAEEIAKRGWFNFEEVEQMCKEGQIQAGRSVAVLLKFLHTL
jgi:hypothetical protein